MLRRYVNRELLEERTLCFGSSFTIDRKQKTVIKQGRKIDLSPSEFNILLFLLDHAGTVVRREEMLNVLPHRKRGSTRNIDTHIKHIRRMLDMRDVIVCVRSVGYRLDEERFLGKICKAADFVKVISEKYFDFCMQKRNEYMVDQSDFVIVVRNGEKQGGTYQTFRYVQRKKKPFIVINLQELAQVAESKIKNRQ